MVVSMTGFGRGKIESKQHIVTVEMKSVNHRFSEYFIRMPKQLMKIEDKLKKKLTEYIKRGKVDVFVTISGEGLIHRNLHIDWNLVEDYYQLVTQLKSKYSFEEEISLQEFLTRPELITLEEMEDENNEIEILVLEAVVIAAKQLKHMRESEGTELLKDFQFQLEQFEAALTKLTSHAPTVVEQYRDRLVKRMKELVDVTADESRILTEVAIFADKSDITEELTRLNSHLVQFHHTLQSAEPIGRKLDFMIQEMNREVNTIGSKANDSSISTLVVELKTILEKLREQIQNVE
ncbi:uncharacterized protein (TIGR00255 family) [Bacillus pakistanensis]|uniref:Uncharacterized protein (TIGR00255 family) n=1 Tax=Rossellomorea pakistanensis TaxID=992288 RepID=A0ABS2NFZ6_9BACI|nr:YicC/YloC family endoribonuclease [Bacillus pakistanensis]MBM7586776.1 uncharacterized protein (TIGR00255 family) [Bacillus pakistanensis]